MSRKTKFVGLALVAMLAFSAIASASAFAAKAPRWKVAGAFLASGAVKKYTGTSVGTITLKGAGLTLTSTNCKVVNATTTETVGEILGTAAGVPGSGKQKLKCEGVKVAGFEGVCTAGSSGTITTNALTGTLIYLKKQTTSGAESVGVLFKPTSGTEFINVPVTGAECSLAGNYPVTGEIAAKFTAAGETEVLTTELQFPSTRIASYYANGETTTATTVGALKVKANEGTFVGNFSVKLSPEEKVGVFPG